MTTSAATPRLPLVVDGQRFELPEVGLRGTGLHPLSVTECVDFVLDELDRSRGGWLQAADLDTLRRCDQDGAYAALLEEASLRVPTGALLSWACRLQRTPLPERIVVSELVTELAAEAVRSRRSLFLIAHAEDTLALTRARLSEAHPGLLVVGAAVAPPGVDGHPIEMARLSRELVDAKPDLVLVGLGSPREEELVRYLRHDRPQSWWLGVGSGLRLVAGQLRAAPRWMAYCGLEWLHRVAQDPRLFKDYVWSGGLHGSLLLTRCAWSGVLPAGKRESPYGRRPPRALLVDDDRFALDHLELLLSTRFPQLEIETRVAPDVAGEFDFYFLDNDFAGERLAARLAGRIRGARANATIIAFSGVLDVETLKHLINVGCDGVCDKADPASWRPILHLMEERLRGIVRRHHGGKRQAFGGVRRAAFSIAQLLRRWNGPEQPGPVPAADEERAR